MSYVVTFEYAEAAPETIRGTIVAGRPETACFRAVRAAKRQCPHRRWVSLVCVLLDRAEDAGRPGRAKVGCV
jgi:hypothetical protein